jgi:D-alanyl-D-alanine dipeptidase
MLLLAALLWADSLRAPPQNFEDLSRIPGVKLSIGYATPLNFTGAVLPGYGAPGAWLRKEAAASLRKVAVALSAEGLGLIIYDAYRPARASAAMAVWARGTGHESWLTEGYISEFSKHNLGIAVDIGISKGGKAINMGTEWDFFGPEAATMGVSGEALENRLKLKDMMKKEGWEPYSKEWWHFVYPMTDLPALDVPYGATEFYQE